jgi:F-type H+-transporting ATPase subunit delta
VPKDPLVASNYAKALLQVVKKSDTKPRDALDEARHFKSLIKAEPKLRVFLEGPQFREEDKENLVTRVFKSDLSVVFFQFLIILLRRDRIEHLFDILEMFEELVEQDEGITPGTVYTAIGLSDEEQLAVKEKLEARCGLVFDLRFKLDPSLIGGVKVQYKDVLIDSSIQTHLLDLRHRLMQTRLAS